MAKFNCVVFLGVVVASIGSSLAFSEDEMNTLRATIMPILSVCSEEFHISKDELIAAKKSHNYDAINPCFHACFFKKLGVLNDQGLFDPVVAKAEHKKYFHSQEDLNKLDVIMDKCSSVNDETVSDGAQGCERAKLLARCFDENKSNFNSLSN